MSHVFPLLHYQYHCSIGMRVSECVFVCGGGGGQRTIDQLETEPVMCHLNNNNSAHHHQHHGVWQSLRRCLHCNDILRLIKSVRKLPSLINMPNICFLAGSGVGGGGWGALGLSLSFPLGASSAC